MQGSIEMKREAEIKELLINNAINLIAEGGFEKATTKELAFYGGNLADVKMNEVYIYRLFGNKERLFEAAFRQLDTELFYAFRSGADAIGGFKKDKEHVFTFLEKAWEFITMREARCRYYVRYLYSIHFQGAVAEEHKKLFAGIIAEMKPIFKDEADVTAILRSVLTTFLDFATCVFNGELANDEINRPHVFNVLYCIMMT